MNGTWSRVEVGGKPADVYEPPGEGPPCFGVLYLHDAGLTTRLDQPAFTRCFDELHLVCVCPHGRQSWWADRVCTEFDPHTTPEQHLLRNVLPFLHERWGLGSRAVGLLGVSMGGQGALRLAFKHPDLFPVIAAIAPTIEYHELYGQGTPIDDMYDSKEQCRQDTAPMHVQPSRYPPHVFFCIDPADPWSRGCERLHEKLAALGVPHEIDLARWSGPGIPARPAPHGQECPCHSWDYFNRMAERVVRFVHAGLDQESRRLL